MPELRTLSDRLADDLAAVRWPDPDEIRARARRRTLRAATSTALAVLFVLAAVSTMLPWLAPDQPTAAPPAPAAAASTPSNISTLPTPLPTFVLPGNPAWIPPEAMLQPADLGPGFRLHDEDTFEPGENRTWPFNLEGECPAYPVPAASAYQRHLHMRVHTVEKDADANGEQAVHEEVMRYPAGTAKQVVADAHVAVEKCARYTGPSEASSPRRPAKAEHSWTVLDLDFAGDESMLARHDVVAVETATGQRLNFTHVLYAVIRVGDLVAVLQTDHYDERRMRQLATRAASWLCTTAAGRC